MSTLSIITACCGRPDQAAAWAENTVRLASSDVEVCICFNGMDRGEADYVYEALSGRGVEVSATFLPKVVGSAAAMNRAAELATGEFFASMHCDLHMREEEWDRKLVGFMKTLPNPGMVGFAGGRSMGHVTRGQFYSSLEDWQVHGYEAAGPVPVAVLDGLAMCCERGLWERLGGMDEEFIHHFYDIDLSLRAHFAGRRNWVVPIRCRHYGGGGASPEYERFARQYGGDQGIHAHATARFRQIWLKHLPIAV
jgi:GT2 family glycosyltransferase